jgi:regulator of replication initiation timing
MLANPSQSTEITMIDVIDSISTAVTIARRIKEINDKIKDAELKNYIGDLMNELGDLKIAIAELKEENAELKMRRNKENLDNEKRITMTIKEGLYYDGDDGPFCTGCWDSRNQKIRLSQMSRVFHDIGKFNCPICKAKYGGRLM